MVSLQLLAAREAKREMNKEKELEALQKALDAVEVRLAHKRGGEEYKRCKMQREELKQRKDVRSRRSESGT